MGEPGLLAGGVPSVGEDRLEGGAGVLRQAKKPESSRELMDGVNMWFSKKRDNFLSTATASADVSKFAAGLKG